MPEKQLILALNAGSSSLKASLMEGDSTHICDFLGERLGTPGGVLHLPGDKSIEEDNMSHETALSHVIVYLKEQDQLDHLVAIGHRVVHGGTAFSSSVIVGDKEQQQIKDISHLAPLHNPHNVAGIETMRKLLAEQNIPNMAVFDTSFHSSIPEVAYQYPLPAEYRKHQMRKFGFHGTSVHYVTLEAHKRLNKLKGTKYNNKHNLIVCHLGNGASVTAVSNGNSMDTSMGFTPLSGLMMGTRSGIIDPSLIQFACQTLNKTVDEVTHDLNKNSGLKAMSVDGDSDMRSLLKVANSTASSDKRDAAKLAVDMFVYRLTQHIASSMIALKGPLDAIVFTAGIGEHSADIRKMACDQLHQSLLPQLAMDDNRNTASGRDSNGVLTKEGTWPVVMVIATDEEKMIAKECLRLISK